MPSLFVPAGDYAVRPYTGFTSQLMEKILVSKSKVQDWAELEKAKADRVAESYRQKVEAQQAAIDLESTSLLAVQLERGMRFENSSNADEQAESIAVRKVSLEEQQRALKIEITRLGKECRTREERVHDIGTEEAKQFARAEEVKSLKDRVNEAKKTTVDDLTRGIVNYKYLGLDFIKTGQENELRFHFTHLDPAEPSKQFSFVLGVDSEDKYEVTDCSPEIDVRILMEVSEYLNKTDDMSYLVLKMRAAFAETLY